MGEKLHRLDVGDRVDDLARDHRPGRGTGLGPTPDMRQEGPDQKQIEHQPQRQGERAPSVYSGQKHHRSDDRGEREEHRADDFGHDIGHRPGSLHLLLRDAPGEIIVEEGDRMAHRPAMQPRQHLRHHIRRHQHVRRPGRKPKGPRPDHQIKDDKGKKQPQMLAGIGGRIGADDAVDDQAQKPGRPHLHRARQRRGRPGNPDGGPGALDAPAQKRDQSRGRRALGRQEGVNHRRSFRLRI